MSLRLYSRANGCPESNSRFVLIVKTSAAPISPPRTRGGTNVSREHPVNKTPPSAGTLASNARREMCLLIALCPDNHRTDLDDKACGRDLEHVDDDEQHQHHRADGVQRTGGLTAAEQIQQPGHCGREAG